jgi:hypothetical protein
MPEFLRKIERFARLAAKNAHGAIFLIFLP